MDEPEIKKLTQTVQELDHHVELLIGRDTFWRAFAKGIVGALGAAVGASLVIAVLVYVLQQLAIIPLLGDALDLILTQIQQNK